MVSVRPPSSVDGITSGNSATNRVATASAIATAVPGNAQPSRARRRRTARRAGRGRRRRTARRRSVPGDRLGPGQERHRDHGGGEPEEQAQRPGPVPDLAVGLQGEEHRAVGEEQQQRGDPAEQGVRVEQGQQVPTYSWSASIGTPRTMLANATPHRSAGHQRADEDRLVPAALPGVVVALGAVLEGHAAHDQRDQDQQQRQVEAGEQGGVPLGEGGEGGAAGDDQPHLVAVPDRADGVDQDAALGRRGRQHRQQHADAEVEALEEEVAGPEHGDEEEPDGGQFHGEFLLLVRSRVSRRRRAARRRARRACGFGGSTNGSAPWRTYLSSSPTSITARTA